MSYNKHIRRNIQTLIMIAYLDNKETFRLEGLSEDYSKTLNSVEYQVHHLIKHREIIIQETMKE